MPLRNVIRAGLVMMGRAPSWPGRRDLPMQAGVVVVLLLGLEWVLRRRWELQGG